MDITNEEDWIKMPLGSIKTVGASMMIRVPGGWVVDGAFVPEKPSAELRERYFSLMEKMAEQK